MATTSTGLDPEPTISDGLHSRSNSNGSDGFTITGTTLAAVSVVVAILTLFNTWNLLKYCRRRRLRINTNRFDTDFMEPGSLAAEMQRYYHIENGINVQINIVNGLVRPGQNNPDYGIGKFWVGGHKAVLRKKDGKAWVSSDDG